MSVYTGRERRETFILPSHGIALDSPPSHGSPCLTHLLFVYNSIDILHAEPISTCPN